MNKRRPVIFLFVGGLNTLLDFLFFTLLTNLIFIGEDKIGIAGFISGTFALLCAYTTHKLITWRDHPATRTTLMKFILFTGFGLWVIRPFLLTFFIQFSVPWRYVWFVMKSFLPTVTMSYYSVASTMAFLAMVIIVMIYNYIVYSKFVFKKSIDTDQKTHLMS